MTGLVVLPRPAPSSLDRGFHALRVKRIVRETADSVSIVFDVPGYLADRFRYVAGQFVTLRLVLDGEPHLRCYSMSSAPAAGDDMQVTVKRVPGGIVSNWLNDNVAEGDEVEVTLPAGNFVLGDTERDVVAFAGGSGITPVFSILKTVLATTTRRVWLLYANRDRQSVIFANALGSLVSQYEDRLVLADHLDAEDGFVDNRVVESFLDAITDAEFYICGPAPFMDIVEGTLVAGRVGVDRVHLERFTTPETPSEAVPEDEALDGTDVTIRHGGRTVVARSRDGESILRIARSAGLRAPSSCEAGECATCMARVVEGSALMRHNGALTPEEVEEGWVLTCQAVPTSPSITVVYE